MLTPQGVGQMSTTIGTVLPPTQGVDRGDAGFPLVLADTGDEVADAANTTLLGVVDAASRPTVRARHLYRFGNTHRVVASHRCDNEVTASARKRLASAASVLRLAL